MLQKYEACFQQPDLAPAGKLMYLYRTGIQQNSEWKSAVFFWNTIPLKLRKTGHSEKCCKV